MTRRISTERGPIEIGTTYQDSEMNMDQHNHDRENETPTYRLRGVGRTYGSGDATTVALNDVDLDIGRGEQVVIAGPSGSGKSTMLQLLGALDHPSTGTVEFEGREIGSMGEGEQADLRHEAIGFVFQQFNLIPTLTASENIEVALDPGALGKAERAERCIDLLDRVGLKHRAGHTPSQMSGGEQQRVAIARALANKPRVLLADEPTGNLDKKTGLQILDLINELWTLDGLTVVLITHDPSITADAPALVELEDGRVKAIDGEPAYQEQEVRS